MNSIACSRFNCLKGTRRIASSAVEERMLVSFFSRTTFTSRSVSFAFSPMIMPFDDFALAFAQLLHHHANEVFGNVDGQVLHWLHQLAIDALGDNLRLADH